MLVCPYSIHTLVCSKTSNKLLNSEQPIDSRLVLWSTIIGYTFSLILITSYNTMYCGDNPEHYMRLRSKVTSIYLIAHKHAL